MKLIDDNDFEIIFGTPPPQSKKPDYGLNLPPEGPPSPPDAEIRQSKGGIKPLNLNDPNNSKYTMEQILKDGKNQGNTYKITKDTVDWEKKR